MWLASGGLKCALRVLGGRPQSRSALTFNNANRTCAGVFQLLHDGKKCCVTAKNSPIIQRKPASDETCSQAVACCSRGWASRRPKLPVASYTR